MKRSLNIFLAIILLGTTIPSSAQSNETPQEWPARMQSVSIYTSLGVGWHTNFSYSMLFNQPAGYTGFTLGATVMVVDGVTFGPHLTFDAIFFKGNHHLDTKVGAAYSLDDNVTYIGPFIPVLSIGYRYQKPGGKGFFRAGLSTAGLGVGVGGNF